MKKILINVLPAREVRVAVVSIGNNGSTPTLHDLHTEQSNNRPLQGNIYKARVSAVKDELDAAFVDYGEVKQGLLALSRVEPLPPQPRSSGDSNGKAKISDYLKAGDDVLVQVDKDPRADKGAALTTRVQLHGQHVILTTNRPKTRISRMITGKNREKMVEHLAKIKLPKGAGVVARTSSSGKDLKTMQQDIGECVRLLELINQAYEQSESPRLLYEENSLVNTVLRDNLHTNVEEILVDDTDVHHQILAYVRDFMPDFEGKISLYEDALPLFTKFKIEKQSNRVFDREISLPSGGQIVLDPTEAFLAVDVNSARSKYKNNFDDMVLNTNLEAVDELFRQMCLRDIGGLVVIDFIDMSSEEDIKKVESRVERACHQDRHRTKSEPISSFGLMQLQRRRTKSSIYDTAFERCANCDGYGHIRTVSSIAHHIFRETEAKCYDRKVTKIRTHVTPEVAAFLTNEMRSHLSVLELQSKTTIEIIPDLDDDNGTYVTHSYRSPYSNKPRQTDTYTQGKQNSQKDRKHNGNRTKPAESVQEAAVTRADLGRSRKGVQRQRNQVTNRRANRTGRPAGASKSMSWPADALNFLGKFLNRIYQRLFSVQPIPQTERSTRKVRHRSKSEQGTTRAGASPEPTQRTRRKSQRESDSRRDQADSRRRSASGRSRQSATQNETSESKSSNGRPTHRARPQRQDRVKQEARTPSRDQSKNQESEQRAKQHRAPQTVREEKGPAPSEVPTESKIATPDGLGEVKNADSQSVSQVSNASDQSDSMTQSATKAHEHSDESVPIVQDVAPTSDHVEPSTSPDVEAAETPATSEESEDIFEISSQQKIESGLIDEASEQLEAVHLDDSQEGPESLTQEIVDGNGDDQDDQSRASNDPRNRARESATDSKPSAIDLT